MINRYDWEQRVIFDMKNFSRMRVAFICVLFSLISFACSSDKKDQEKNNENSEDSKGELILAEDYFYPKDTIVQMYVYQNTKNPDDRYHERVVYKKMEGRDHFFVTRYDAGMKPQTTFSYWNNNGEIILMKANVMVGRVSYEAKIQKNLFMADNSEALAQINYDYPANDSIIHLIEVNRYFEKFDKIDDLDGPLDVIVYQDSVRISFIDTKNKQNQSLPASMKTYYGKGVGKIMEESNNRTYKLIMRTDYGTFESIK